MRCWLTMLGLVLGALACGRTVPLRFPPQPGDGGVDAGVPDGGTIPCIPGFLGLSRARPTVMFVIDRSGSMGFDFGATTRWGALTQGLARSLPAVDQTMAIGAYVFPAVSATAGCRVPALADLSPATGNVTPLIDLLSRSSPRGGTPTADALAQAAVALRGVRAAKSARALVLATDGAPGCNPDLDPFTCICTTPQPCTPNNVSNCLDDVRTLDRLRAITASGLPTWVIGIQNAGDTLFIDVLDRMAVAGGRPRASRPRFYPATSPAELEAALVEIRDQVSGCTFLTASVPDAQGVIRIFLDGVEIPEDPGLADGWSWVDRANGEVVFAGRACTTAGQAVVTANVGCSGGGP